MPISPSSVSEMCEEVELLERKVATLKAMLEFYGDKAQPSVPAIAAHEPEPSAAPVGRRPPVRTPSESTTTIRRVARELITANDRRPVSTREVIATVKQEGVAIRGANELSAVSAVLSRSPDFTNIEKQGWVLTSDGSA